MEGRLSETAFHFSASVLKARCDLPDVYSASIENLQAKRRSVLVVMHRWTLRSSPVKVKIYPPFSGPKVVDPDT
jgi:hypothetical protein